MPGVSEIHVEALLVNVQVRLPAGEETVPVQYADGKTLHVPLSPPDKLPFKVLGTYKWIGCFTRNGPDHFVVLLGEFDNHSDAAVFAKNILGTTDNFKLDVNIRLQHE